MGRMGTSHGRRSGGAPVTMSGSGNGAHGRKGRAAGRRRCDPGRQGPALFWPDVRDVFCTMVVDRRPMWQTGLFRLRNPALLRQRRARKVHDSTGRSILGRPIRRSAVRPRQRPRRRIPVFSGVGQPGKCVLKAGQAAPAVVSGPEAGCFDVRARHHRNRRRQRRVLMSARANVARVSASSAHENVFLADRHPRTWPEITVAGRKGRRVRGRRFP